MRIKTVYSCSTALIFLLAWFSADAVMAGGYNSGFKNSSYGRSWSGCYLGLQGGYGLSEISGIGSQYDGSSPGAYKLDLNGFVGGLYAGCNRQSGRTVLGLESDIEYSNADGDSVFYDPTPMAYLKTVEYDWLGSVRARAGFVASDALFYLTAGWAYSKSNHTITQPGSAFYHEYSKNRDGWTLGGGIEKFISNRFIARLEYRYSQLEGFTHLNSANNSRDAVDDTDISVVRLGIAAKF